FASNIGQVWRQCLIGITSRLAKTHRVALQASGITAIGTQYAQSAGVSRPAPREVFVAVTTPAITLTGITIGLAQAEIAAQPKWIRNCGAPGIVRCCNGTSQVYPVNEVWRTLNGVPSSRSVPRHGDIG